MTDRDTGLYMDMDTLGKFARNTAAFTERGGFTSGKSIAMQTRRAMRTVKSAARECSKTGVLSSAKEWLADNWYLAQREGSDAVNAFFGTGKLQKAGGKKGKTVLCDAASALVHAGRGEVTAERMLVFLDEYQKTMALSERELALFIPAVKSELLLLLESECSRLSDITAEEEQDLVTVMKNIFTSLRTLPDLDAVEILESVNRTEVILRKDPSGIYPLMDEETRYSYRRELSRIAAQTGVEEHEAAQHILKLTQMSEEKHVGYYIYKKPLGREKTRVKGGVYVPAIVIGSLFFAALSGYILHTLSALLLLVPISEIVKNIVDFISMKTIKPTRLPRMELSKGVPPAGRTICVVSALLSSENSGEKYAKLLEEYRLSNRDAGENLLFGILADLPESKSEILDSDDAFIKSAKKAIEKLNSKYGGGFYLLMRGREYNKASNLWMAKERKRGAIQELVRMLSEKESSLYVESGDEAALFGVNFILTLDADTRLTAGSAKELIACALHPMNVPFVDVEKGVVTRGHGIIQPRVSIELNAANRSDFTRVFAGTGGIDPYGAAVSDIYQDVFGRGSFVGKGLINVPAYMKCIDNAFPENSVLSHDLLEGAYLNCAFCSDVELTDGYPYKVAAYYSRLHRWTRGDWQNINYLCRNIRNASGEKTKNHLCGRDKWKIFDNLRRSAVPVFTFAAVILGMLASGNAFAVTGIIAALSSMSGLLISTASLALHHDGSSRTRYHSTIISGFAGILMQTFLRLVFLPVEAWTELSAIITALWRKFVSKRRILEWVTSSDMERKLDGSLTANYIKLLACPITGILVILASPFAAAAAVGIVWLFAPALGYALSREVGDEQRITAGERAFLVSCAADIWKYFKTFLKDEDNWLPPDNFQEEPAVGVARRTSPTNIGLALLSCLSAYDLNLAEEGEILEIIDRMLKTVENLPKWNGHLYNWYDTAGCQPMEPRYVSTVDSGNLCGCLITLGQALLNMGRTDLSARCYAISESMDFRPLYDSRRRLFSIGWDIEKNLQTEGWYDLLASEARQTSFIAIARGDVSRKHWRKLGRSLVSLDNFSGMASWTGTMFEYLMPNLILPCYKNSLLYESARFCIYAQKRANSGIPWGMSESAFYAFDPGLSYRYKAHGVQRLALKRGMGLERVISPYSTFLALPLDMRGAVKNLKRLASIGITGKFGYYESADFTPSRQTEGKFQPVRTYMAHHLGMSIIAIDNAISAGIMQKRFMSDRRMCAFSELLEERVPTGEIVLRQTHRDVPEKPARREGSGCIESFSGVDASRPRCLPLSNGEYSLLLSETGHTRSMWREREITRFSPDIIGACGMEMYLKTHEGIMPLLPAPVYDKKVSYSTRFFSSSGKIISKSGNWTASVTMSVPPSGAGEIRTIEVAFTGTNAPDCQVICVFEPTLERRRDFEAHPAFSKLAMQAEESDSALIVKRRAHGERKEAYLCLACDRHVSYQTVAKRGVWPESAAFKTSTPEMRASCTAGITLKNGKGAVTFAMSAADTREDALLGAKRMLEKRDKQAVSRLGAAALMLSMDDAAVRRALLRIPDVVFGTGKRGKISGEFHKKDLWRFGISGDIPLMAAKVEDVAAIERAVELVSDHALLSENGIDFDLALLLTDGGDYRRAQKRAVMDYLHRTGRDRTLGVSGGVFLIDALSEGAGAVEALATAWVSLNEEMVRERRETMPATPYRYIADPNGKMEFRFSENGEFEIAMLNKLPDVSWSNVIANNDFGYLATDSGTGHMWYKNARESKLNRWMNDPLAVRGTERVGIIADGKHISLFADGDENPLLMTYGFGYAAWEKRIGERKVKMTSFVPLDIPARVLLIECEGFKDDDVLSWYTDIILGEGTEPAAGAATRLCKDVFEVQGSIGTAYFASSEKPCAFTTDRAAFLRGELDGRTGAGFTPCYAAEFPMKSTMTLVCGFSDRENVIALTDIYRARKELDRATSHWRDAVKPIKLNISEPRIKDYVNGWTLYQTLCCRITARTGLYQNGGAYGFRDQLQDVCAITASNPEITVLQLKNSAAHQYREGDCMHWWHPMSDGDKGVRTRCSDDLLWLPYVLCDYVNKTGDAAVCKETAPWLISEKLSNGEDDRYEKPLVSKDEDTLLTHAMAAADCFLMRGRGEHGLALFGGGDWNDGMNEVGKHGRGESVWLSWFGSRVLSDLSKLCRREGQSGAAARYEQAADELRRAATSAWDGEWFLRGYFDDATPLGTHKAEECRIDSIAQSFSVFAGADREKSRQAILQAYEKLYDRKNRVVKLFAPAFSDGETNPGYIKTYAPGFRENGGQYTHGAVWLAMALLEMGCREEGYELLCAMSPVEREMDKYKAEPYVIAADVYSAEGHEGRAGWTWYTGAAGWYWRAITETLLGLRLRTGRLFIEPNLPDSCPGYSVDYKTDFGILHIEVGNAPERRITVNGEKYSERGYKVRNINNNFISTGQKV